MMGHKICFHGEIWLIISKLSLLPLLIWSFEVPYSTASILVNKYAFRGSNSAIFSFACLLIWGDFLNYRNFVPKAQVPSIKRRLLLEGPHL